MLVLRNALVYIFDNLILIYISLNNFVISVQKCKKIVSIKDLFFLLAFLTCDLILICSRFCLPRCPTLFLRVTRKRLLYLDVGLLPYLLLPFLVRNYGMFVLGQLSDLVGYTTSCVFSHFKKYLSCLFQVRLHIQYLKFM